MSAETMNPIPAGSMNVNDIDAQSRAVTSVNEKTRQLVNAIGRLKWTRFLLLLAIALFICATCYVFYRLFAQLQEKEHLDKLMQTAQARLVERNDVLMKDVQALVDHSTPVVTKAFNEQFNKDLPGFLGAVQSERDLLVEGLRGELTERLQKHHEQLLTRHEKLLREEFPEIQDEQLHVAMMANLNVTIDALVKKYYIEELESEMKSLYENWDDFPVAPPAEKGDLPLEDQLVANLLELLKAKLAEGGPGTSDSAPSLTPSATLPGTPPVAVPADLPESSDKSL